MTFIKSHQFLVLSALFFVVVLLLFVIPFKHTASPIDGKYHLLIATLNKQGNWNYTKQGICSLETVPYATLLIHYFRSEPAAVIKTDTILTSIVSQSAKELVLHGDSSENQLYFLERIGN